MFRYKQCMQIFQFLNRGVSCCQCTSLARIFSDFNGKHLVIVKLFILLTFSQANIAHSIERYDDPKYYDSITSVGALGRLNVLVIRKEYRAGREFINPPSFDLILDGTNIGWVTQNASDIKSQEGILWYASVHLPSGLYDVQIRGRDDSANIRYPKFSAYIKHDKAISFKLTEDERGAINIEPIVGSLGTGLGDFTLFGILKPNGANVLDVLVAKKRSETEALKNKDEVATKNARIEEFSKSKIHEDRANLTGNSKEIKNYSMQDDLRCKSFGAKPGSSGYINCRTTLEISRLELESRDNASADFEKKFLEMQKTISESNIKRDEEANKLERIRQEEQNVTYRANEEERKKREKTERLDRAQKYFETAAKLAQPPQSIQPETVDHLNRTLIINGKAINCNTTGSITNCR